MSWRDEVRDRIWTNVVAKHLPRLHQLGFCLKISSKEEISTRDEDIQFVSDEIEFIYGKFLHSESSQYLAVERVGRGRPLGPHQRALILAIYNDLCRDLAAAKHFDASEMPRLAFQLLASGRGESPLENYSDIIVDEVQDLSDMELRVLLAIEQISGQLFLVGDGAQQIFRRGQSLRRIGINVSGRSFILRKNYRNTAEITAAATKLRVAEGIGRFDEDAAAAQLVAIPSATSGDRPALLICSSPELERKLVLREITYLINKLKIEPNHICCLARSAHQRTSLLSVLKAGGISARDYRAEDSSDASPSVLVSTLHNSKGHEFRAVFIFGLNEGYIRSEEPEEIEREAAILYVAMTRAKELLYLSYHLKNSAGKPTLPSRFVADLREVVDVLEFQEN
jgi:superfamily I DNA/RNA helicase